MSLTGSFFLNGVIALTIVAFIAVILIWPRLTRRTPWHIAGRVGSLAVVNVLVLFTAATQLNAYYLFYANWADLAGSFSGNIAQTSVHRGGGERQAPDIAVAGVKAAVATQVPPLTQTPDSTGKLVYTVHGPISGLTGTVVVVLPPGYTSPADATERYPVLEACHGYPSAPQGWLKNFPVPQDAQQLAAQGQLRTPLLVIPQIEFPAGVDTEGVNGQLGQPQVETWLTRDVPNWVGAHFRVDANRSSWATIGDSAGGYVAAMAALLHPAQYGAGIVFGGYYRPDFGPYYEPFAPDSALGRRYDLVHAEQQSAPPVSLWVQTSHADPLSYTSSAAFLRAVHQPTAVHAVVLRNAGHRLSVWVDLLPEALRWLGQNVQGFEPGSATTSAATASTTAPITGHPTAPGTGHRSARTHGAPAVQTGLTLRSPAAGQRRSALPRSAGARRRSGGRRPRPSDR